MSLATRLTALANAVGADIKTLNTRLASIVNTYGYTSGTGGSVSPANNWKTVPIAAPTVSEPAGAFTRNADGSVTVRDAGWYQVSATVHIATPNLYQLTIGTAPDAPGGICEDYSLQNIEQFGTPSGAVKLAAGAKLYVTVYSAGTNIFIREFSIAGIGPQGPVGLKGDPGGIVVAETLDWNTAITPNFYRSTSDFLQKTIHGPGDQLNPPRQAGIVTSHANGTLSQRVWDLDLQVGYTRFKKGDGTWTPWVADLVLPPLLTGLIVGAPAPKDGDERYFQNAAMLALGVVWKFRYNGNEPTANKWQFVGGSKYASGPLGDITTASAAAVALTGGPTLTIPLDGVYEASIGATLISNAVPSGYATASVYKDAVDAGLPISFVFQNTGIGQATEPFKEAYLTLTAGQIMSVRVSCANSTSNRFVNARIGIRPVRVLM